MKFLPVLKSFLRKCQQEDSLAQMSKEMGYDFNIWYRWKSGSRHMYWGELVKICDLRSLEINNAIELSTFQTFQLVPDGKTLLRRLYERYPEEITELFSTQKISRIVNGKSDLKVEDFSKILSVLNSSFKSFVDFLFPVNSTTDSVRFFEAKLIANDPLISLIKDCLELNEYKAKPNHSNRILSKMTGEDIIVIKEKIDFMERHGIVKKIKGKYVVDESHVIDLRGFEDEFSEKVHDYYFQKIRGYLERESKIKSKKHQYRFAVYGSNPKLEKEIQKLSLDYFSEVAKAIAKNKQSPETIKFLKVEFFDPLNRD